LAPVLLVVPLAPVPPEVGLPAAPALPVPPVGEMPVPLPLIVPPVPVESGMPPTLVAAESVPSVLLGVEVVASPVLPLQAPSSQPPSSKAAKARPEWKCRITEKNVENVTPWYTAPARQGHSQEYLLSANGRPQGPPLRPMRAGRSSFVGSLIIISFTMTPRAQEKLYFESPAGRLYYNTGGYVHLAWGPERLSMAVIETFYEQVLALLSSTGSRRILSEHGQRAPLSVEAQQWITNSWIPRAMTQAGVRHCAIVEGANPMHRLSTQSVVSAAPAGFLFKRFDAKPEAEAWLASVGK
jgi:hypothetical protein